jgi:predicted enzyme related to lactoylglutathione lyase
VSNPALNLVVIRSVNLDRAAGFYRALGVQLCRERHGSGPEHLAGRVGAAVFEVYPAAERRSTIGVRLGFLVGSVADAVAGAQAAGGAVVTPGRVGPWGFQAVVSDPDGHRVELTETAAGL